MTGHLSACACARAIEMSNKQRRHRRVRPITVRARDVRTCRARAGCEGGGKGGVSAGPRASSGERKEVGGAGEGDSPSAEPECVVGRVHAAAALRVLLALEPLGVEVLGARVELLVVEDRPVPRGVEEGKSVPVRRRRAVALEHAPHVRDALRGRSEWR